MLAMIGFLTLKEASRGYEVSVTTLRRLVREVVKDAEHEHRHLVQPSVQDYEKVRESKDFEYQISMELLALKYKQTGDGEGQGTGKAGDLQADMGAAALKVLEDSAAIWQEQCKVKDGQIKSLHEQINSLLNTIDGLSEGQRMTNLVMKTLDERLRLPSAQSENPKSNVVTVPSEAHPKRKAPTKADAAKPKPKPAKQSRGVFRIFGRSKKQPAAVR